MNAIDFFNQSTGHWKSQRTTHHLAFQKFEHGQFDIQVEALPAKHPKVIELCQLHNIDASFAIGGAYVGWEGSMEWDKEPNGHKDSTIFALIPESGNLCKGKLLRDHGYAETIPVAGQFYMDDQDALILITEYEVMSSVERFWFENPNLRMRTSTVKRFGSFTTATFCTEMRIGKTTATDDSKADSENLPSSHDQASRRSIIQQLPHNSKPFSKNFALFGF